MICNATIKARGNFEQKSREKLNNIFLLSLILVSIRSIA
jgi:hypothetical protein